MAAMIPVLCCALLYTATGALAALIDVQVTFNLATGFQFDCNETLEGATAVAANPTRLSLESWRVSTHADVAPV